MRSFKTIFAGAVAAAIITGGPVTAQGTGPDIESLLQFPQIPQGDTPQRQDQAQMDGAPAISDEPAMVADEPAVIVEETPAETAIDLPEDPVSETAVQQTESLSLHQPAGGPEIVPVTAAPAEAEPSDPVAAMHEVYNEIRADIFVVYEEGNKIAWKGDLACVMRLSGWKPWSSGNKSLSEAAEACREISGELSSAEIYEGKFDIAMDRGTIKVSQELGSGANWGLARSMTCGLDGTPIATLLEGYADRGKEKVRINTPRAFSVEAAASAEQECLAALKSAL